MLHFYKDDQETNLSDLYNIYEKEHGAEGQNGSEDIPTFPEWVKEHKRDGHVTIVDDSILSLEAYFAEQERKRISELSAQIANRYLLDFPELKKNGRREKKKEYKKSEEYKLALDEAIAQDPQIIKFRDSTANKAIYDRYLKNKKQAVKKRYYSAIDDFLWERELEELRKIDVEAVFQRNIAPLCKYIQEEIDQFFINEDQYCKVRKTMRRGRRYYHKYQLQELKEDNLEKFFSQLEQNEEEIIADILEEEDSLEFFLIRYLMESDEELSRCSDSDTVRSIIMDENFYEFFDFKLEILEGIDITPGHVLACLMENEIYREFAKIFYLKKKEELDRKYIEQEEWRKIVEEQEKKERLIRQNILSVIPDNYPDFYPLARRMKRHFVLHMGPTNSGKTYSAMQALKKSGNGAYFAPLRLLAYEQFENMNREGCMCDLITGEEKTFVPFSTYQSATIEMADLSRHYSKAVIDEAQMIADRDRGGAWTAAILGLVCEEIHVCSAPHALDILVFLIEQCGDSYEVIWHQRNTKLLAEKHSFDFPESVEKGDALIVFSKKNVHAVASELQRKGIRCNIIYGNLPYDVRQEEARKFHEGRTDVVVATDAIGMGMNLPIRRIVFLEISKFDGKEMRYLRNDEIQQIAGRAGRRGMFDEGYVTSFTNRNRIRKSLNVKIDSLQKAVITFPESLIGIPAKLSETMERWDEITTDEHYEKANLREQMMLCSELEAYSEDKELIYRFITIPFDPSDQELKQMWLQFFFDERAGKQANYRRYLPDVYDRTEAAYMNTLEHDYRICDLLYAYMDKFHRKDEFEDIIETKRRISDQIMKILEKQKLIARKCKSCGRILSWNHPFGICERCHFEGRQYHW